MFTATLTLEERIARAQTQLATARAVDDPALSKQILQAVAASV